MKKMGIMEVRKRMNAIKDVDMKHCVYCIHFDKGTLDDPCRGCVNTLVLYQDKPGWTLEKAGGKRK